MQACCLFTININVYQVAWGRGGSVSHWRISLKQLVSKSEENGEKEVGIGLITYKRNFYPFLLFPQNNCYRVKETPLMTLIAPDNVKRIFRNSQVKQHREWPPQWSSSTWPSAPSWPSSSAAASLAETQSPSSSKTPGSCQEQQAAGPSLCLSGGAKLDILMCDKCSRKKVWHTYTSVIHCHNDILLKTPKQKFHP